MSYDVSLYIETGGPEALHTGDWNYTWNCSQMFYDAMDGGVNGLNGMKCEAAAVVLEAAIKKMKAEPAKYKAMNPENGWGSYEGAIGFLASIMQGCYEHPKCTVSVT